MEYEGFTAEDVAIIHREICPGATQEELAYFLAVCRRRKLDPLSRQIYAVRRWSSKDHKEIMQIQTSIDGFRLVAERSGRYDGQEGPLWCGPDGVWHDVWLDEPPPTASKVGVWKSGAKCPTWGVAKWSEYAQRSKDGKLMGLWRQYPDIMLSKCAESLALRKAFPEELSGLYTAEEMSRAGDPVDPKKDAASIPSLASEIEASILTAATLDEVTALGKRIRFELGEDHPLRAVALGRYKALQASIASKAPGSPAEPVQGQDDRQAQEDAEKPSEGQNKP